MEERAGDALEQLLVECLERVEREGGQAVDAFLREHPEHAHALRRELATLEGLGLFEPRAESREDLPAERVGEFRIVRRLGEGGMGVVYLAEQTSLRRLVALKVLRAPAASGSSLAARFQREALAIAKLRHPSIVTLFAAGVHEGTPYLAMELVPGRGLDEILQESRRTGARPPLPQVIRWGSELARALHCAHAAGIVHRDVKPSNVRITPDGRAMLLDFGLARDLHEPGFTRTGAFQGSPHYASPEQVGAGHGPIGTQTDVYSLGVTLYECATGELPFRGETTEQIFQATITRDPEPPRRRNPSVPRDLETVLLKAMEKHPARRFATAADLGDDLDAILELRPIASRRPGLTARLSKWARRNSGTATGAGVAAAALVVLAAFVLEQRLADQRERLADARAAVERARELFAAYQQDRDRLAADEYRVVTLRENLRYRYFDPAEDARFDQLEAQVERSQREREMSLVHILALLQRVEAIDPGNAGARKLRVELYAEKFEEAENQRDPGLARFYRDLARALDPRGELAPLVAAKGEVSFASDPPGAEVLLFRYRELAELSDGGERRLVPVPVASDPGPIAPGTWCLRVIEGAGDVESGDLLIAIAGHPVRGTMLVAESSGTVARFDRLVAIDAKPVLDAYDLEHHESDAGTGADGAHVYELERDGVRLTLEGSSLRSLGIELLAPDDIAERGGVPATLYHDGVTRDVLLPEDLRVRTTAAPLAATPSCRAGTTPLGPVALEPGGYLAVFRLAGHGPQRYPFAVVRETHQQCRVALAPEGAGPVGFVRVVRFCGWPDAVDDFWLQEREVTFAEYLEFLDDPATQREIERSEDGALVPREPLRPHCARGPDGRFALVQPEVRMDWPVLGVSWFDARAYARWRTARARAEGSPYEFALPTLEQWKMAGCGADRRTYVFGSSFRPKWVKSNYARPKPNPESVLSYPVDESVFGAFDMSGSVLEWLEDWYQEGERRRTVGGSWGQSDPGSFFLIEGGAGMPPDAVSNLVGFRLVARRTQDPDATAGSSPGRDW